MGECWASVADDGPAFTQHWANILCYRGRRKQSISVPEWNTKDILCVRKNAKSFVFSRSDRCIWRSWNRGLRITYAHGYMAKAGHPFARDPHPLEIDPYAISHKHGHAWIRANNGIKYIVGFFTHTDHTHIHRARTRIPGTDHAHGLCAHTRNTHTHTDHAHTPITCIWMACFRVP